MTSLHFLRCESLAEVNAMLREQLVAANDANADLADDLRKVTEDWNMMKEEVREKEAGWREDQKVYIID